MTTRPTVFCFAAFVYDDGQVWGTVHRVSLETAEWMRQLGYAIVGPDPHDLFDLKTWEDEQRRLRGTL